MSDGTAPRGYSGSPQALPNAAPTILFIGNDFVRKGGPYNSSKHSNRPPEPPDARLQLVGTNPPGVISGDGIEVLGRIHDRDRIEDLYRNATVFVMPSHFEPVALVLIEAMANWLPAIASRSCGISEIIQNNITREPCSTRSAPPRSPTRSWLPSTTPPKHITKAPPAGARVEEPLHLERRRRPDRIRTSNKPSTKAA